MEFCVWELLSADVQACLGEHLLIHTRALTWARTYAHARQPTYVHAQIRTDTYEHACIKMCLRTYTRRYLHSAPTYALPTRMQTNGQERLQVCLQTDAVVYSV